LRKSGDATADNWSNPMAGKSVYAVWLKHLKKQHHSKNDQHKHYSIDQKEACKGIPFLFSRVKEILAPYSYFPNEKWIS
jgi:hypothetical protein